MTNDDDCVSIDVAGRRRMLTRAHTLSVRRKSAPLPSTPSARHSILLISSQNTEHPTTYVARK